MYTFSVLLRVDDIDLVHIEVDIALCLRAEQSAVVRVLHNGIDIPHAALICTLVVNDKFVLLALGIECALDRHRAVVSEPIALELDAVNRYSGYVPISQPVPAMLPSASVGFWNLPSAEGSVPQQA